MLSPSLLPSDESDEDAEELIIDVEGVLTRMMLIFPMGPVRFDTFSDDVEVVDLMARGVVG